MSITRINTNTDALLAGMYLNRTSNSISKTLSHLSTGLKIVTAADDPSGLALATNFKAQVRGTTIAIQNAEDGLSLLNTADSALSGTMDILLRMRDLAVRASTDATLTTTQRQSMESEIQKLKSEITKRKTSVTFNGKYLFSGGLSGKTLQVGTNNGTAFRLSIQVPRLSVTSINGRSLSNVRISQVTSAQNSIDLIASAITGLASLQTIIGCQENALERIINDLNSQEINMSSALSRIQDADMASEISSLTRQQVLAQAATAMVAQANVQPQTVMSLLGIG